MLGSVPFSIKFLVAALFAVIFFNGPAIVGERVLLMPVNVKGIDVEHTGRLVKTAVDTLSKKYVVVRGGEVDRKVAEIFEKESKVSDRCDIDFCLREIAQSFDVELIASVSVLNLRSTCHITFKVHNVMENRVIFDKSSICSGCGNVEIDKSLRALVEQAVK